MSFNLTHTHALLFGRVTTHVKTCKNIFYSLTSGNIHLLFISFTFIPFSLLQTNQTLLTRAILFISCSHYLVTSLLSVVLLPLFISGFSLSPRSLFFSTSLLTHSASLLLFLSSPRESAFAFFLSSLPTSYIPSSVSLSLPSS